MDTTVIEARLAALTAEFSSGQRLLAEHEAKATALREQLLRISGAMRVLYELLGRSDSRAPAQRAELSRASDGASQTG